jgi:hypothetical protein
MTRRKLSCVLAWASLAAATGCTAGKPEPPENCVARFEKLIADGPDLGQGRFLPIFTYDITHVANVLERLAGDPEKRAGLRVTIAQGASDLALKGFYAADVPRHGAIFAADNVTLFRITGTAGSRHETLVAGCRGALPEARLVHVQWNALRPGTDDLPECADPGV